MVKNGVVAVLAAFGVLTVSGEAASLQTHSGLRIIHATRKAAATSVCPTQVGSFREATSFSDSAVRALEAADREIAAGVSRARRELKAPPLTIRVRVATPGTAAALMGGVSAVAIPPSTIALFVDPIEGWQSRVAYLIAHEYHHLAARALGRSVAANGLGILLDEGRADAFAASLFPGTIVPWTRALTQDEEARAWMAIQPTLARFEPSFYNRFMFGIGGEVPRWAGYTIGFHIVQTFLSKRSPSIENGR